MLTGDEARRMKKELTGFLKQNNAEGIMALERTMETTEGSLARLTKPEVDSLIDNTLVIELKDTISGKLNYTYRINHPDASETKFYNVVMRILNGYKRVILIEYDMAKSYAPDYYDTGNLLDFTGHVSIDVIVQEEGDPCEEDEGGGGGSNPWLDPVEITTGKNPHSSYQIIWMQFQEMNFEAYTASQNPVVIPVPDCGCPGQKLAFDISDATGPCDEDEVAILAPPLDKHTEDCLTLAKLKSVPAILTSLVSLKADINQSNEKLFSFKKLSNGNTQAIPQSNNSDQTATMSRTSSTYGVAHIHQKGIQTKPSKLYQMFSFADLKSPYFFAKDYVSPPSSGEPHPIPMFFNMMVVEGYVYAVFPNDPDAFTGLGAIFDNDREIEKLDDELNKLYSDFAPYNQASQLSLAEIFLNFINNSTKNKAKINFNMSLYRVSNASGSTGKWEKLELDPATNQLKPATPCP